MVPIEQAKAVVKASSPRSLFPIFRVANELQVIRSLSRITNPASGLPNALRPVSASFDRSMLGLTREFRFSYLAWEGTAPPWEIGGANAAIKTLASMAPQQRHADVIVTSTTVALENENDNSLFSPLSEDDNGNESVGADRQTVLSPHRRSAKDEAHPIP